jgi:hypothetical protein
VTEVLPSRWHGFSRALAFEGTDEEAALVGITHVCDVRVTSRRDDACLRPLTRGAAQ